MIYLSIYSSLIAFLHPSVSNAVFVTAMLSAVMSRYFIPKRFHSSFTLFYHDILHEWPISPSLLI